MSPHPAAIHPEWCDPRCCQSTDVGVQHCSAPTVEKFSDEIWQFTLVGVDEYSCPRETSPELRIDVTNTIDASRDTRHVLRPEEVRQLTERLTTEYRRAQLLNRPAMTISTNLAMSAIP